MSRDSLDALLEQRERRRVADVERFCKLDEDECQLCGARGEDKRSLVIECLCDVGEVVPEAIDLSRVYDGPRGHGYYLRICKACRGRFLACISAWAGECRAALHPAPPADTLPR